MCYQYSSQTGVIFQDDYFEYQQPYVIFKIECLSHNSIQSGQISQFSAQTGIIFWDNGFEY